MQSNKERILGSKQFSLAHLALVEQPVFELIKIAEAAQYEYVSPRLIPVTDKEDRHEFVGNNKVISECKALLRDSRVRVLDVELLSIKEDTSVIDKYEPLLEAATQLHALYAITQIHVQDVDVASRKFEEICLLGKKYNIDIVLEILPWSAMSNLQITVDFLEKINPPNAGILFDLLHLYRANIQPESLTDIDEKYFKFVHLCDARGSGIKGVKAQKHIAREARYPAGRGDIPVLNYLEHMPASIYSLEIPNERIHRYLGPQEYASYILEDTKNYLLLESCWRAKSKYISIPKKLI